MCLVFCVFCSVMAEIMPVDLPIDLSIGLSTRLLIHFYRIRHDFNCQKIVKGRTNYMWRFIVDSSQKLYGKWKSKHGENEKSQNKIKIKMK